MHLFVRSSAARRIWGFGLVLAALGCSPDAAPGVPQDFQRAPVPGGSGQIVRSSAGDCGADAPDAAHSPVDAGSSQLDDAGAFDAPLPNDSRGCEIDGCELGLICCPFDGRCNPPGCTTCCSVFLDGGTDAE